MTVYMAVTDDEYELPIAVAYTTQELEKMLGLGRQAVYNYLNRARKRKPKKQKYLRIELD